MIITKSVKIKVNGSKIKYYSNLGYEVPYNNVIVDIDIKDLSKGSNVFVDCVCDICGSINHIQYNTYCKNIKNTNIYTCYSKCSNFKKKNTLKERYGDERKEFSYRVARRSCDI